MTTIRTANSKDEQPLFELVARIDNFTSEEKELAREVVRDGLASEKNGYHILVAENEQALLAGFICYGPIPITLCSWDLYWIAVHPDQARRGMGSRLLAAMERRLTAGSRIYIDTSSTEGYGKARSFYQRHGYSVACVLADFYRPGDDKILFAKVL